MDTTIALQNGLFTGITAYDIFVGDYGFGFLFAALAVTLLGNLARKYNRFRQAVETIKDFDWRYWLIDNAVGLAVGFPVAWIAVRAIDELAPLILKSELVSTYLPTDTELSAPVMVIITCIAFGWLIDKYVPSPNIEKLMDPEK